MEGRANAGTVLIALQPGLESSQEMGNIPVRKQGSCNQIADRAPVAARQLTHQGSHAMEIEAPGLNQLVCRSTRPVSGG